jgi:hypothetical protein
MVEHMQWPRNSTGATDGARRGAEGMMFAAGSVEVVQTNLTVAIAPVFRVADTAEVVEATVAVPAVAALATVLGTVQAVVAVEVMETLVKATEAVSTTPTRSNNSNNSGSLHGNFQPLGVPAPLRRPKGGLQGQEARQILTYVTWISKTPERGSSGGLFHPKTPAI